MKYIFTFVLYFFGMLVTNAQVGINTTEPEGTLDVVSINNTGLVLPRVTRIEDVTDGNGGLPLNGTTVYDTSRNMTCFYQDDGWTCISRNSSGDPILIDPIETLDLSECAYIKASNTDIDDRFGQSVAISDDGTTMVIGSNIEASNGTGINSSSQSDNSAVNSGAVYVFTNSGGNWIQQAYIKASNGETGDYFGYSVALSEDGNTLAVGATLEDSNGTGADSGSQTDNSIVNSGAVYVFYRSSSVWIQESYIKASNTGTLDNFGFAVSLSNDGNVLAVSTPYEDSSETGINGGLESDNSENDSGAVYVFSRSGGIWTQDAYIKASNTETIDLFGIGISISGDGNTLAVGAEGEDSNGTGVNSGAQSNNSLGTSGAVYVFNKSGSVWTQEAYIKTSNPDSDDRLGTSVALSDDGTTFVASATSEDSNGTGVNSGTQTDNSIDNSGAIYVFVKNSSVWSQEAYIKASNSDANDNFGNVITLSGDGMVLAIGSYAEDSNGTGIDSDAEADNSATASGAVYIFSKNTGNWAQESYVKAVNAEALDLFGWSLSITTNGGLIAIGAINEDSNGTGVDSGAETDNSASASGAVYLICND